MPMWSGIVDNAAQALNHPDLTGAVRTLHPGVLAGGDSGIHDMGGPIGYADGGQVDPAMGGIGAAPGAPPDPAAGAPSQFDPNDPRMGAIADAEDALGTVEDGSPLQPQHVQSLQAFTNTFGPTALAHLHANVKQGLTMRPRKGRLIVGAGSGKSDGVPARVNNTHEAKLSTGAFVMPADAVHGAGNGDPALGARRLQQLSAQLAAMKPASGVKPAELTPPAKIPAAMGAQPPVNVDNVQPGSGASKGYALGGAVDAPVAPGAGATPDLAVAGIGAAPVVAAPPVQVAEGPRYLIVDKETGKRVGQATTFSGARLVRDRRDNAYGSYQHRTIDTLAPDYSGADQ